MNHEIPPQRRRPVGIGGGETEEEAERVADAVTGGVAPALPAGTQGDVGPLDRETADAIGSTLGGGQELPVDLRSSMAPGLGESLEGVRLHQGAYAERLATGLGAQAFSVGRDVYLGAGQQPSTGAGRRLIAHELAHVVHHDAGAPLVHRLIRTPYPWRGVVTPAAGGHIRSAPDATDPANVLDTLPRGTPLTVMSSTGAWLRVSVTTGKASLIGFVHHTLVDDATAQAMEADVGTKMTWHGSGPGSGTTFEAWASAATETPFPGITGATVMNCWEAVLLNAHRSGSISWSWIHALYKSGPATTWAATMARGSGRTYATKPPKSPPPQRGDLVFFDGVQHVALATGNGSEIYTFWPPPKTPFTPGGTVDRVKVSTIEDLVAWWIPNFKTTPVVTIAPPAW